MKGREGGEQGGGEENNNNDKINNNGTRKGREQMHQKASGPQRGLPVSKLASLGSSAIGTDHTSQAVCFVVVFFCFLFLFWSDLNCVTTSRRRSRMPPPPQLWAFLLQNTATKAAAVASGGLNNNRGRSGSHANGCRFVLANHRTAKALSL